MFTASANAVSQFGQGLVQAVADFGRFVQFAGTTASWLLFRAKKWCRWRLLGPQLYSIGVLSIPVVAITGAFIGMVLALEGYSQFEALGQQGRLGGIINVSVTKQIGPVLAAVMVAGRVGGALAAELGTMRVTEQLDALRAIPGCYVFRPADGVETAMAWAWIAEHRDGPALLALSRQTVKALDRPAGFEREQVWRGAYVVEDPEESADVVLVATGSEVSLAVETAEQLRGDGLAARVVSLPCLELFLEQSADFRRGVIPDDGTPVVAVEAARGESLWRVIGANGLIYGIDRFGASAVGSDRRAGNHALDGRLVSVGQVAPVTRIAARVSLHVLGEHVPLGGGEMPDEIPKRVLALMMGPLDAVGGDASDDPRRAPADVLVVLEETLDRLDLHFTSVSYGCRVSGVGCRFLTQLDGHS